MKTAETQKEQIEVAQTPQRLPDGRVFQYKPKAVAKWYQLYEKGEMEALVPPYPVRQGRHPGDPG